MKNFLLFNLLLAMSFFGVQTVKAEVVLNSTNFPDPVFRMFVSKETSTPLGEVIPDSWFESHPYFEIENLEITSLKGIEYFVGLKRLECGHNKISTLDLSHNTQLEIVRCAYNELTSLNVSTLTKLTSLDCGFNELTSLDVSHNTKLQFLHVRENQLTSLDVTNNSELKSLYCDKNNLTSLNVANNLDLEALTCDGNKLSSLDVSMLPLLYTLSCRSNKLTSLDVTHNMALEHIDCNANSLTSLDVTKNWRLRQLYANFCNLQQIDLTNNSFLEELDVRRNPLTSLYLDENPELRWLFCADCQLSILDLYECKKLEMIYIGGNRLLSVRGLDQITNPDYNSCDFGEQKSTRRFYRVAYNSSEANAWALPYSSATYMNNADRIENFKVDGIPTTPIVYNGWLIVSTDLKEIPRKVTYDFKAFEGKKMSVIVNYDVIDYSIKVDGVNLTSLNMNDIPGAKEGKAYIDDESAQGGSLGWANKPTLILDNATLEWDGKNEGIYSSTNYSIKVIGDCSIKAPNETGIYLDCSQLNIKGGGKLHIFSKYRTFDSWLGSQLTIQDNTVVIAESEESECYYSEEWDTFTIKEGSVFAAYSKRKPIDPANRPVFGEGIDVRYPVGAYLGDWYVLYADGTEVKNDWVFIGPGDQATQDLIATGVENINADVNDNLNLNQDIYNLAGQKVGEGYKGIVIKDGKKILRK